MTALLLIYVLTSFITGYISARLYRQMGGKNWTWNIITAALVFPGPLALVWSFLNSVAWSNASTAALPAATVFIILGLFIFVSFPLSVVGGIAGRNSAGDFDAPCRTKKVAREVGNSEGVSSRHVLGGSETVAQMELAKYMMPPDTNRLEHSLVFAIRRSVHSTRWVVVA